MNAILFQGIGPGTIQDESKAFGFVFGPITFCNHLLVDAFRPLLIKIIYEFLLFLQAKRTSFHLVPSGCQCGFLRFLSALRVRMSTFMESEGRPVVLVFGHMCSNYNSLCGHHSHISNRYPNDIYKLKKNIESYIICNKESGVSRS